MSRQAILNVSREVLLPLLPEGKSFADLCGIADESGDPFAWLAKALYLPPVARITGVSTVVNFCYDLVSIRVQCPDFVETAPGNCLPEVQALYGWDAAGKAMFACWHGPAVGTALGASEVFGPRFPPPPMPVKFREFL